MYRCCLSTRTDGPRLNGMSMHYCDSPPAPFSTLSKFLRSQGLSAGAVIDDHLFFHLPHTPDLQCSPVRHLPAGKAKIVAVKDARATDLSSICPSVQSFVDHPLPLTPVSVDLSLVFINDWVEEVTERSVDKVIAAKAIQRLLEIERWLADDGPGSCALLGHWIVWSAGRHGMSDLILATNQGDRPDPDMFTAGRWDRISEFTQPDLDDLNRALEAWSRSPSVWNFSNRDVPTVLIDSRSHLSVEGLLAPL